MSSKAKVDVFDFIPTLDQKTLTTASGKPTCVTFADKYIYVGTTDGQVCLYQINGNCEYTEVTFSKSLARGKNPVTQIEINHRLKLLFVLCDNNMTVHKLEPPLARKPEDMLKVGKATHFCQDIKDPLRICVALKKPRKLQLFAYSHNDSKFVKFNELAFPDKLQSMVWYGNKLCMGFPQRYAIMDVNGNVTPVDVPLDTSPCMQVINGSEILVAASMGSGRKSNSRGSVSMNNLGIFLNFTGETAMKNPVPWPDSPIRIVTCDHYVICLLPNDLIHITSLLQGPNHVQTIKFPKGIDIASSSMYAENVSDRTRVVVASDSMVAVLTLTSPEKQMRQYLNQLHVDQAYELLEKTSPSERERELFHTEAGFIMLANLRFPDAFAHFSKAQLDPREVLALFPELTISEFEYIPSSPFIPKTKLYYKKLGKEEESVMNITELINKGLGVKSRSESKQDQVIANMSADDVFRAVHLELSKWLWQLKETQHYDDSELQICLDTALLFLAVELEENTYKRIERDQSTDVRVDPTICTVSEAPYTVNDLLTSSEKNHCLIKLSLEFLFKHQRYHTMAQLYQSRGMNRKALEVWQKVGQGDYRESRASTFRQNTRAAPDGARSTVVLLSELPDDPLIWEFSKWVLQHKPEEGMKIFTSTSRAFPLPPDKVLKFLSDLSADHASESFDFVEAYLQHLIMVENNQEPKYHDQLALRYVQKVAVLHQGDTSIKAGNEPGLLGKLRSRLLAFLRTSYLYDVNDLLSRIKDTKLYEEKIILFNRNNQHSEVLEIYIFELKDHTGACNYCLTVEDDTTRDNELSAALGKPRATVVRERKESTIQDHGALSRQHARDDLRSEVFVQLLRIYFDPSKAPPGEEKRFWARGLLVLDKYSLHIQPVEALKVIPPDIPLSAVNKYLKRIIPHTLHKRRDTNIVRSLARIDNLQTKRKLYELKKKRVSIDFDTKCPVCFRPLSDWFKLDSDPMTQAVHHHCYDKYKESLLTKPRDKTHRMLQYM